MLVVFYTSCSKKPHNNLISKDLISERNYSIKDSVYFDMALSEGAAHEGLKEYKIKIKKLDSLQYQASYSCSIDYFLDCACQISDDPLPLPFTITYKAFDNVKVINNDNVEIIDLSEPMKNLKILLEENKLIEKCEKLKKNATKYIGNEEAMKKKFLYFLSHIHRYEKYKLPSSEKSINNSKYSTIDLNSVHPFTKTSDAVSINPAGKEEINIWKTRSYPPKVINLQLLKAFETNQKNQVSMKDVGDQFLENKILYKDISDMFFEFQSYTIDTQTSSLENFNLVLKSENGKIKHHMYRSISKH